MANSSFTDSRLHGAKDAALVSESNSNYELEAELGRIGYEINAAANTGKFGCFIGTKLSMSARHKLLGLGYEVETKTSSQAIVNGKIVEQYYISWSKHKLNEKIIINTFANTNDAISPSTPSTD